MIDDVGSWRGRWLSLIGAVERLSLAKSLEDVIAIVRETARDISGADGVTFVLRDGDRCHYVDEDAVGPLWKGLRFPLTACISGWCMLNRQMAVIPDIYLDPRIPHEAYRPTFVKSLVMTPVRVEDPLAAIGAYWSDRREFAAEEVALLEGLARSTAAALGAIQARERNEALQQEMMRIARVAELSEMSAALAHELKQPLSAAVNYLSATRRVLTKPHTPSLKDVMEESLGKAQAQLTRISDTIKRVQGFVALGHGERAAEAVELLVREALEIARLHPKSKGVDIELRLDPGLPEIPVDRVQVQQVLLNLLRNAFEAVETSAVKVVTVRGRLAAEGEMLELWVEDSGPGLSQPVLQRLFDPFVTSKADGVGVGLSISKQIALGHGGDLRADRAAAGGAAFCLTLPLLRTQTA